VAQVLEILSNLLTLHFPQNLALEKKHLKLHKFFEPVVVELYQFDATPEYASNSEQEKYCCAAPASIPIEVLRTMQLLFPLCGSGSR
jgi:hypothetical protein